MAGFSRISRYACVLSAAGLLCVTAAAWAQSAPPQTVEEALHQMSDEAAVIFAGTVTAVKRPVGASDASGVVEIDFQVDQAVRGCSAGEPYVLREWAGLWAGGAERYQVGERRLMFLRAPSTSGLSSPVDGMDGAVPIHGEASPLVAGASTAQYPVADLRWVATEVLHPVVYRAQSAHPDHRRGMPVPFAPHVMVRGNSMGTEDAADIVAARPMSDPSAASVPEQQTSVRAVLVMLRSWQKVRDEAR